MQARDSNFGIVTEVRDHAQVQERLCYVTLHPGFETDGQGLLGDRFGALVVTPSPSQERQRVQRPATVARGSVVCTDQGLFQPGAAFLKMSAAFPEAEQGCRTDQSLPTAVMSQRPAQRLSQVVMLDFEAVQRGAFVLSRPTSLT